MASNTEVQARGLSGSHHLPIPCVCKQTPSELGLSPAHESFRCPWLDCSASKSSPRPSQPGAPESQACCPVLAGVDSAPSGTLREGGNRPSSPPPGRARDSAGMPAPKGGALSVTPGHSRAPDGGPAPPQDTAQRGAPVVTHCAPGAAGLSWGIRASSAPPPPRE